MAPCEPPGVPRVPISGPVHGMFSKCNVPGPIGSRGHSHTTFSNGRFHERQSSFHIDVLCQMCALLYCLRSMMTAPRIVILLPCLFVLVCSDYGKVYSSNALDDYPVYNDINFIHHRQQDGTLLGGVLTTPTGRLVLLTSIAVRTVIR